MNDEIEKNEEVERIKFELIDALQELKDAEAEVCQAEMDRDTAKSYVDDYKKELLDLGFTCKDIGL